MSILTPHRTPVSRYQPRVRELPPLPPRWRPPAMWERHRPDLPLWRFVILSMLLHALGILLFGAPAGGSREGRAMWGSLDVVIRDSFRDAGPSLRFDRTLGSVPAPGKVERMIEPPRVAAPERPAPPTPEPPLLDRLERQLDVPAFEVPKPPELLEPPRIEAPPSPAPKPIELPHAMQAPAVPRIERQLAEPPRIEAPLLQPLPLVEPAKLDPVVAPRIERQLAEPPKLDAPIAQPVEARELPAPPVERAAPAPAPAAPAPQPAPPAAQPAPQKSEAAPPQAARDTAAPPVPSPSMPSQSPATSPFRNAPSPAPGAAFDPTTPALDLDAMRRRAGQIARQGTGNRAALPFPMPPVQKPKTKMQEAIEKARKPDCRTAYQELGLAAVVPLIANEFGEGSCRW